MQPVPEGYKPLGFAGFTDKGTYTASEVYAKNDIVHNNNTTWRCLVNGTTDIAPEEGVNWTVFIASENDSSGITTTDTEGLVGPVGEKVSNQGLIDVIAEKVAKQMVTNTSLANTLAEYVTKEMMSGEQVDDPDKVPTSALAYAMQEKIDALNGNLGAVSSNLNAVTENVNNHSNALQTLNSASEWHTTGIADINSKIKNMFTMVTGSAQYTLKAGQSIAVNIAHNIPSGYKVLGVVGFYSGNDLILPYRIENSRINLHSVRSDDRTATATITVLCAKDL